MDMYIEINENSRKWLVQDLTYLLIRRFSSKEEKRRIVCAIYNPSEHNNTSLLGIDNKVNYLYSRDHHLPEDVVYGLYVYLSSSKVDAFYRIVSGHTQVNSGDIRALPFPSIEALQNVGATFSKSFSCQQDSIDRAASVFFSC